MLALTRRVHGYVSCDSSRMDANLAEIVRMLAREIRDRGWRAATTAAAGGGTRRRPHTTGRAAQVTCGPVKIYDAIFPRQAA